MKDYDVVRVYYLVVLIFNLGLHFFAATYVLFLQDIIGLDELGINLVNTSFALSVFLLEVPTGAIADMFGRKRSFILGCGCLSASMFFYFFARTFWACILAEVMAAIGLSLKSGALEAWFVGSMGEGIDLNHVFKRKQQFGRLGSLLGSIASGYIGRLSLALPWFFSGVAMMLVTVISQRIMVNDFELKKERPGSLMQIAKDSIRYGFTDKSVFRIICLSTLCMFVFQPFNMYWQLRFTELGIREHWLGWVFAGISVCIAMGAQFSSWFKKLGEWRGLLISQFITSGGMLAASLLNIPLLTLASFYVHECGRGIYEPLKETYINKRIPEDKRATILSFEEMISKIGMASGLIFSGFIAKNFSKSVSWIVSSIILTSGIAIFLKIDSK